MAIYKNIRLEERVYQELVRRMKPRESMSQVIERMITQQKGIASLVDGMNKLLWGD